MTSVFDFDRQSPGNSTQQFEVSESSHVGQVRRAVAILSESARLDGTTAGRAAIIATEGCNNLIRHGGGGAALIRSLHEQQQAGVEIIFCDKGPGMRDLAQCLLDGYSTIGTQGSGLGAMRRSATLFDIFSAPDKGTVVLTQLWDALPQTAFRIGAVSVPKRGEEVCGDAWIGEESAQRLTLCVADGLGHGPMAAEASRKAMAVIRNRGALGVVDLLQEMHGSLRPTRGAAAAVASITNAGVTFAGVGNISGVCWTPQKSQHMVSHNGTLGHQAWKFQEFSYGWHPDAVIVMHSDGISTQWHLDDYPGAALRHPSVIAALIYRDFCRGRDDATILVAKNRP